MNDPRPNLPLEIIKRLTELLTTALPDDMDGRRAFLYLTLASATLRQKIAYDGVQKTFVPLLIKQLWEFGDDSAGVPALCALVDQVRDSIGHDKKVEANTLHAELKRLAYGESEPPAPAVIPPVVNRSAAPSMTTPPKRESVFIAHAHTDQKVARALCDVLEEQGDLRAWLALRDIPPAADWAKTIAIAIRQCGVFVLVCSEAAQDSDHVYDEVNIWANNKPRPPAFVLRIEDCRLREGFDLHLGTRQMVNAFAADPSSSEAGMISLRDAVRGAVGLPPVKPTILKPINTKGETSFAEPLPVAQPTVQLERSRLDPTPTPTRVTPSPTQKTISASPVKNEGQSGEPPKFDPMRFVPLAYAAIGIALLIGVPLLWSRFSSKGNTVSTTTAKSDKKPVETVPKKPAPLNIMICTRTNLRATRYCWDVHTKTILADAKLPGFCKYHSGPTCQVCEMKGRQVQGEVRPGVYNDRGLRFCREDGTKLTGRGNP